VNIGGALAEARSEAGLTITEVSKRTRIRETIIRDIERDDYSACGGDFYARGHIRAIARVVGADPVPLIEQYDAACLPPPETPAGDHAGGDATGHSGPGPAAPEAGANPELNGVTDPPDTMLESARRWAAARRDADGRPAYSPPGITAAEAFRPGLPMDFERRRPRAIWLLGLVVLALIGAVIYLLVSRGSSSPGKAAATPPHTHHSAAAAAHRTGSASPSTTTPAVSAAPATTLTIASAAAFGPAGTGQGDDPQDAALAIDGNSATSWHSDWYATPQLGGLQSGTGLLLSLGKAATITSATVVLGPTAGGTVELRAGDTATLANLSVAASSTNPGGTLTMRLSVPVQARYALLWFTSLPPDGAGTYQVSVYDVRLMGYAG
jgi:hypothetical protein